MTAEAIAERADALDIRLTADAQYLDVPAKLPDDVEETIHTNRNEVLYRLALKEHAQVLARLEELRQRIDDESIPYQERETLAQTVLDVNLDRLSVLEHVVRDYERSGLAQWYTKGWLMFQSELLGRGIVVVVRDRDSLKNVPDSARQYTVYTFAEVKELDGCIDEQIQSTQAAKRAFAGEIDTGQENSTTGKRETMPTASGITNRPQGVTSLPEILSF